MQSIHLTPVVSENGHSPSDGYFDITNKNDNGGNNDKPMFSRYQQVCNDGKEEHGIDSGCLILILDHYLMHHRKFYNLLRHLWVLVLMCGHLVMYAMIGKITISTSL